MPRYGPELTPGLAARIVLRVARGIPIETVARQLGLSDRSVFRWSANGQNPNVASHPLVVRLSQGILRARAHREWHTLRDIDSIADNPLERSTDRFKALTWRLERHPAYRDRYGIKVEHNVTGNVDHSLRRFETKETTELLDLAPGDFKALMEGASEE